MIWRLKGGGGWWTGEPGSFDLRVSAERLVVGKKGREGSVVKAEERVVFWFLGSLGIGGGEAEKRTRDIHVYVCTYIPEPAVILCMYCMYYCRVPRKRREQLVIYPVNKGIQLIHWWPSLKLMMTFCSRYRYIHMPRVMDINYTSEARLGYHNKSTKDVKLLVYVSAFFTYLYPGTVRFWSQILWNIHMESIIIVHTSFF